jgi:tetraacyldisaccharide 4'-kinase/lipopolysaccharide heptosyltransferase II
MTAIWHNLFKRLQEMDESPNRLLISKFLLLPFASSLSGFYGLGAITRRALYTRGWLKPKRLPAPVISIGNLTVGGTGKTPMTACLARLFQERGCKIAILSRGYGGTARGVTRISDGKQIYARPPAAGEEAYWLARTLPGVAVYTAPERHDAGLAAWREMQPDLFLLDDGFQHIQLHRDLDMVLLDADAAFGNGYLLPRGPLREPLSALAAARVLVLTRYRPEKHRDRLESLQKSFPGKTVLTAAIMPTKVFLFPEGREMPRHDLKNRSLLAFAGLARPRVFSDTLRDLGANLTGPRDFPDHHPFSPRDLDLLVTEARSLGASALITTAKDWSRLGEKWDYSLPLWVLEVEAQLEEGGGKKLLEIMGEATASEHFSRRGEPRVRPTPGQTQGSPLRRNGYSNAPDIPLPPEVQQRLQELQVQGNWRVDPATVRRVLVRVPNWVGDAVMALPTLAGVQALFPQAAITVLAAPRVAPLFAGQPGVAEVVIYPPGLGKWRAIWWLRHGNNLTDSGYASTPSPTLPPQGGGGKEPKSPITSSWSRILENRKQKTENRKPRFDLGLALPNSWEAALNLWLAGAKARLGYDTQGRGPLLNLAVSGSDRLAGLHTVYYLLGVLEGLGGVKSFVPPRLYLREEEVKAAADLLISEPGAGPWVGLSPGAAFGPAKRWPPERFAALGLELQKEFGVRLALLGGPEDRAAAAAVKASLPGALDLSGRTTLRQALGVLTHLKLLITNDSGLMHAAAALRTPLVAIFGSTDPAATGPFTDRAAVLHHPLPCSPCLQRTCDRDYQCLLDITVPEVLDAAREWLKEGL